MSEDEPRTVREGLSPRTITPRVVVERKLDRGDTVGRYLVLSTLGEGGMGVVYAAYDPELDRKVAIKLLQASQAGLGSHGDQAWLLREAQAMARLQHPNVLAVHDVGTLDGDRVFVAMELVEGPTLREWTRLCKRHWREVVAVMRAAGAGLAAAHAAGLVHRDFKPDNVLVGNDGRARVMDFGLARLQGEQPASRSSSPGDREIPVRSPLSESLTVEGTVAGTPGYMAPEVKDGAAAGARSDQFAFGVALYEALYRTRPFDKDANIPKAPPADTDVPARITKVVMRALAPTAEARYPSMDALLEDLVDEPDTSRRTVVALGLAIAAAAGAIAIVLATRATAPDPCAADNRLAGVWDDATKAATRAAFTATKSPLADASFTAVSRELDRYTAGWTDAVTDSCRATKVRAEQPDDVMALRATCYDERREEAKAFVALLTKADPAIVEKAVGAAASLEPIVKCANVGALQAPTAPPPGTDLNALRVDLSSAKAALITGRVDAIVAADKAVETANKSKWPVALAETQLVRGHVLQQIGQAEQASEAFSTAIWAGERSRRDDVVADGALWNALTIAEGLGKPGDAAVWLALGEAAAQRTGDRLLDLRRHEIAGAVAGDRGDFRSAVVEHEAALAAADKLGNSDEVAGAENMLAATLAKSGDYGKAAPHYEHALAIREASVGHDHPDIAVILSNLGPCYDHTGDTAKAKAALGRALAIKEAVFGKTSLRLIGTLNNYADFLRHVGDVRGATASIERAFTLVAIVGTAHPMYHTVATTRGQVLFAAGKATEARAALDAVIAFEQDAKSPVLPITLAARADIALADSAWKDAAALDERAIAIMEAAGGKDSPDLWQPLAGLARAKAALGDAAAAKSLAARAVAIGRAARISDAELGPALALAH